MGPAVSFHHLGRRPSASPWSSASALVCEPAARGRIALGCLRRRKKDFGGVTTIVTASIKCSPTAGVIVLSCHSLHGLDLELEQSVCYTENRCIRGSHAVRRGVSGGRDLDRMLPFFTVRDKNDVGGQGPRAETRPRSFVAPPFKS